MPDLLFRVPVTCPRCGEERLTNFSATMIGEALGAGNTIRLFASCHGEWWSASYIEREQLKEYLDAQVPAVPQEFRSHGSPPSGPYPHAGP
jgi:hypothetical protein